MVGSSLAPKWPILVPFCGMDHQKSNFSLILALFLSEAVEASRCQFFENWWMKLKCPLLLKPPATIVQENSQSFYPSEPFRIYHFTMRHPVYRAELWGSQHVCYWNFTNCNAVVWLETCLMNGISTLFFCKLMTTFFLFFLGFTSPNNMPNLYPKLLLPVDDVAPP